MLGSISPSILRCYCVYVCRFLLKLLETILMLFMTLPFSMKDRDNVELGKHRECLVSLKLMLYFIYLYILPLRSESLYLIVGYCLAQD